MHSSLTTGRREQFTIVPQNYYFLISLDLLPEYCVQLIGLSAVCAWFVNFFFHPHVATSWLTKQREILVNLLLFSSTICKSYIFLTKLKLVTTFWIKCWDGQGTVGLHYFCLIDWFWIQCYTSVLSYKSKALFYSRHYQVTSQLRTLMELWRESNFTSLWNPVGQMPVTILWGKRRRNQPIRGPFLVLEEPTVKFKS